MTVILTNFCWFQVIKQIESVGLALTLLCCFDTTDLLKQNNFSAHQLTPVIEAVSYENEGQATDTLDAETAEDSESQEESISKR